MHPWWHNSRCFSAQIPRFLVPSPPLRASISNSWPRPKSRSNKCSPTIVAKTRRLPYKPRQQDSQHRSEWRQAFVTTITRYSPASLKYRIILYSAVVSISGATIVYLFVLERVPITGRRRISWLSHSTLTTLDEVERQILDFMAENEEKCFIRNDYPGLRKIEAVFARLAKSSGLDDIKWEIRIIDEPNVPFACVFRFGLVLITTGFFHHVIANDDELATVLGHEVAHVVAGHVLESESIRLADKYFTEPFAWLALLSWAIPETIFCAAPFLASYLASLALSRIRETEADYVGLLLMADAGFNVSGAVSFWKKLNQWEEDPQNPAKNKNVKRPQFESTHPHTASRITQIEKRIPEVLEILRGLSSAGDETVTRSRRVVAMQNRWQDFARKRDESRQLVRHEVETHTE